MKRESQNVFKDERDEMEHIGEKREGDVSMGGHHANVDIGKFVVIGKEHSALERGEKMFRGR